MTLSYPWPIEWINLRFALIHSVSLPMIQARILGMMSMDATIAKDDEYHKRSRGVWCIYAIMLLTNSTYHMVYNLESFTA
jgi:hypothetical protein